MSDINNYEFLDYEGLKHFKEKIDEEIAASGGSSENKYSLIITNSRTATTPSYFNNVTNGNVYINLIQEDVNSNKTVLSSINLKGEDENLEITNKMNGDGEVIRFTSSTNKNVVGTYNATSDTSSELSNGNVYLNNIETFKSALSGETVQKRNSSHLIIGQGFTKVTATSPGNIVINTEINNADGSNNGLMTKEDKIKLNTTNIAYGTCYLSSAVEKIVNISGNTNWILGVGSIIIIRFYGNNTASNPTLNVNSTGAKPIWYNNKQVTTDNLLIGGQSNTFIVYVYDGNAYRYLCKSSLDNSLSFNNTDSGEILTVDASGLQGNGSQNIYNFDTIVADQMQTNTFIGNGTNAKISGFNSIEANTFIGEATRLFLNPPEVESEKEKIFNSVSFLSDGTPFSYQNNIFNVKNYGAIGNGETDDTTAIQNAVNLAIANQGTVYFPNGTYKINDVIYCGGNPNNNDPLSTINYFGIKGEAYSRIIMGDTEEDVFYFNADVQYLKVENLYFEAKSQTHENKIFKFRGFLWNSAFEHIQANGCGGFIETRLTGNQDVFSADIDDVWFTNITVDLNKGTDTSSKTIDNCCIGFKIGSGSSVWLNNVRVIGPQNSSGNIGADEGNNATYDNTCGVYLFSGMGGFFTSNCDFIRNTFGLYIPPRTYITEVLTAPNREVFLSSTCFDSCECGIFNGANVSFLFITDVWFASNKRFGMYVGGAGVNSFEYGESVSNTVDARIKITGGTIYNNNRYVVTAPESDIVTGGISVRGTIAELLITNVAFLYNGIGFNYFYEDNQGKCMLQNCVFSGSASLVDTTIKYKAFHCSNKNTTNPIYFINCIKEDGFNFTYEAGGVSETLPSFLS